MPRFGNADHAKLEGWLAQIERYAMLDDWVGIEVPHREFHRMLVSGAGDRITALLGTFWDHASRYRTLAFQALRGNFAPWETSRAEHRAIVDAFEAYDAPTAASWAATQIAQDRHRRRARDRPRPSRDARPQRVGAPHGPPDAARGAGW